MTVGINPLFGRNRFFKGDVKHLVTKQEYVSQPGGVFSYRRAMFASQDGKRFAPLLISGDLAKANSTANPEGAFACYYSRRFKGKTYLFGTLWANQVDPGMAACFSTVDHRKWTKEDIPYAVESYSSASNIVGVSANDDFLAAVTAGGPLIWTDGNAWFGRNDLPLAGRRANAIGLAPTGVFIGTTGTNGSLAALILTATSLTGTFASRTHSFSYNSILLAAVGDTAILTANDNPTYSSKLIASAPLNNLTTWSYPTIPASIIGQIRSLVYGNGKWFARSTTADAAELLTAATGSGPWTLASAKPWTDEESGGISAMYFADGAWNAIIDRVLKRSEDNGASWQAYPNNGLDLSGNPSVTGLYVG